MTRKIERILAALLMLAVLMGGMQVSVFAEDAPAADLPAVAAEEAAEIGQEEVPLPVDVPILRAPDLDYPSARTSPAASTSPSPAASTSPSPFATAAPTSTACAHRWSEWENVGAFSCTAGGLQIRSCSLCKVQENRTASGSHDFSVLLKVEREADCKTNTNGYAQMACSRCAATQLELLPPEHDYSILVRTITAATCVKKGSAVMACSNCRKESQVETEKTGHVMVATKVYTQATCTTAGREDQKCKYCAVTASSVTVPAYGHDYGISQREEASCEVPERIYRKCSRCSELDIIWEGTQPALGHVYGETMLLPADCLHARRSAKVCSRCGDEVVSWTDGAPLGHNVTVKATLSDSTCDIAGKVIIGCSRCAYEETRELPLLDHTPAVRTTSADCTEAGYKETYCSVCNSFISRVEVEPVAGHKYVTESVGATCEVPGVVRTACSVCGDVKSQSSGTATVPHKTQLENVYTPATCQKKGQGVYKCIWCNYRILQEIPMLDHDYKEVVTTVSCTEDGKVEIICSACKDVKASVVTEPALGHDMKLVDLVKQVTCETSGIERKKCERCDYDTGNVVIPALGHNYQEKTVPATCTERGYRGVFCTNCEEQKGEMLEYMPATGHNFTAIEYLAPTCTEAGHGVGEHCVGCGMVTVEPEVFPATGHTRTVIPAVAAKCGIVGYTEGVGCSVCEEVLVAPTEIPALSHIERALAPVAPTCDKNGLGPGKICSICSLILSEQAVIPAFGHSLEVVLGTEPTCTTSGLTFGEICSTCKAVLDPQEVIPALGHTVVLDKGTPASCLKAGMTDGSHCSVCNAILQQSKVIPMLDHEWEISPDSSRYYICYGCGQEVSAKPSSVTIDESDGLVLAPGESLSLSVTYSPDDSYSPLTWSSSAKKIVAVDADGNLEAIKEGSATITVRTESGKKDTLKVKVVDPYKPTEVRLDHSGTIILAVGEELELYAELFPDTAESELKWTSSKPKYAEVDENGLVTALKIGSSTITVKTENGLKDTVKISVVSATKPYSVALDQDETITLEVGDSFQLFAEVLPATAETELKWTSSKKAVAYVDEDGLVEALAEGTATITVSTGNSKKDSVKIEVIDPSKPAGVELSEEETINLEIGDEYELYASIYPDTAESELSWRSNRTAVATVDQDGVITAVGVGSATISVTTENGKVASVRVKVS